MTRIVTLSLILLSSCMNHAHSETRVPQVKNYKEEAMQDSNGLIEEKVLKQKIEDIQKRVNFITSLSKEDLGNSTDELAECLNAIQDFSLYLPKGSNARKAHIYFASVSLRDSAFSVRHYLSNKNEIDYELAATDIYANIILNFFNTNYALVGDGMIKSALVHEKTQDFETSKKIYSAILKDFIVVIERLESSEEKIDEQDEMFFALSSLEIACNRLIELDHLTGENANADLILERIKVWRKSQAKL